MSDIVKVGEHQNGQQIELEQEQTLRVTLPRSPHRRLSLDPARIQPANPSAAGR